MLAYQMKWLSRLLVAIVASSTLPLVLFGYTMKSSKFLARIDFNGACKSGFQATDLDVHPPVAMCVNYPDGASSYLAQYAGGEVRIEARLQYSTNSKAPETLDKLIRVGKSKVRDPNAIGFWGYAATGARAMTYPPSGADSRGTASQGTASQSTAVPNSPQTKLIAGVPQSAGGQSGTIKVTGI
jgi:hypothetical protein